MSDWNFADVWDAVATVRPDAPAVSQGRRRYTWAEMEKRANGIASGLVDAGLGHQSKVAQYLYSSPEYLESLWGIFKAAMVPVNTNYRYTAGELRYLWENADAEAVVFGSSFVDRVEEVRGDLPQIRLWIWVSDGERGDSSETRSLTCPSWAVDYETLAGKGVNARSAVTPWGRSGDDLLLIYTGGTTGMPKGVMWRQDDLFCVLTVSGEVRYPEDGSVDDVVRMLSGPLKYPPPKIVPCAPLMHGTGLFTAFSVMNAGGSVVLLPSRHFSAEELLDTIETEQVTEVSLVGDAFARPILDALDASPGKWDLSSLWLMISSGVMWSAEVKAGLLRHIPRLKMTDSLGSSEAIGLGRSVGAGRTAGFKLGPRAKVITEEGKEVVPGSGEAGLVAIRGRTPIGYYKDEQKTAATFRVIDGVRWSVPGDWARVEEDGTVHFLGRGSVVINTGGEKVFPEEVEEALKSHPSVSDALVVGLPHQRFGEQVIGVVELAAGASLDSEGLITWVRQRLAAYKAPRQIIALPSLGRAPNGKADYKRVKAAAAAVIKE